MMGLETERSVARAVVYLALVVMVPGLARAQGYRGSVTVSGQWLEIRGVQRDSLPEADVAGSGTRRQLEDGTVVTCIPNGFCQWYAQGGRKPSAS